MGGQSKVPKGPVAQAVFLEEFAKCGNIARAARVAGIARRTHYSWLDEVAGYRDLFEDARIDAVEALEEEARRRAVDGDEQPVYQGGEEVGTIRKFSDSLLMFLLRANAPEKYSDKVTQQHEGAVEVLVKYERTPTDRD